MPISRLIYVFSSNRNPRIISALSQRLVTAAGIWVRSWGKAGSREESTEPLSNPRLDGGGQRSP